MSRVREHEPGGPERVQHVQRDHPLLESRGARHRERVSGRVTLQPVRVARRPFALHLAPEDRRRGGARQAEQRARRSQPGPAPLDRTERLRELDEGSRGGDPHRAQRDGGPRFPACGEDAAAVAPPWNGRRRTRKRNHAEQLTADPRSGPCLTEDTCNPGRIHADPRWARARRVRV